MVLVPAVVRVDVLEDFDLVQTLIEEVLIILDDLDADVRSIRQVHALHRLRKRCRSQKLEDLVASSNDAVDVDRIVLGLLEACPIPLVDDLQVKAVVVDRVIIHFRRILAAGLHVGKGRGLARIPWRLLPADHRRRRRKKHRPRARWRLGCRCLGLGACLGRRHGGGRCLGAALLGFFLILVLVSSGVRLLKHWLLALDEIWHVMRR
mmetsp:Transcript_34759/g.82390  ORF Transcript_34759/g.82390 Transcript_34759/m.82390 type:complete len:207 (+) Transcript_34759:792-1412(+)